MAIPGYQTFMLPVLKYVGERSDEVVVIRDLFPAVASQFNLRDDDLSELLPSGTTTTFVNRVSWVCTYLKKAGLLSAPRRGCVAITQRGLEVLAENPSEINNAFLRRYPEFLAFQARGKNSGQDDIEAHQGQSTSNTPHESIEIGYQSIRSELAVDLLQRVKECTPAFFERLVVELLVKMGYGGSRADAGRALGRSGDGGIDGIIKEDRLGLDAIFIQAKRWADKPVGRPDVQQFAGALAGHGAVKGIFITTSNFTRDAAEYSAGLRNSKIVLIGGEELAELMIDNGIGVATAATYEVKRIDSDYFVEGE